MLADSRLKLRHLTLVLAIAKHGTMIRAAESLHVTQPVLSRGLQELEAILGVKLFDRNARGMTLTVFGESFHEHAQAIDLHLRDARTYIQELADATTGTVTVGVHLAGANLLLPRAIAALKAERPGVTVVVREASPDLLRASLLAGEIDMTVGRLTDGEQTDGLRQIALHTEPIHVVSSKDHAATRIVNVSLANLVDFPWVLPGEGTDLRQELGALFKQDGLALPANYVESTSIQTVRTLLVEAEGIAVLPFTIARADAELTILPIELPNITRRVGATLRENRQLSPSAALLLKHLRNAAGMIDSEETG